MTGDAETGERDAQEGDGGGREKSGWGGAQSDQARGLLPNRANMCATHLLGQIVPWISSCVSLAEFCAALSVFVSHSFILCFPSNVCPCRT
jgi:hypothetical protein